MPSFTIHQARKFNAETERYDQLDYNSIHCHDTPDALEAIRKELEEKGAVEVHNNYETFYGVRFDRWLRDGVADLGCTIEAFSEVSWLGFPSRYIITKK